MMPIGEIVVFNNKAGTLTVLKAPGKGGNEQVMFLENPQAVTMQRLLSEHLGVHMEVKQETVTDNSNELIKVWEAIDGCKDAIRDNYTQIKALKTLFGQGGK